MRTTPPARSPQSAERFRGWYASTYQDVRRFVQRRAHTSHTEDVVADAYLVAWRRFEERPEDHDESRAWLLGIARGCLANARRSVERQDALRVRIGRTPDHHSPGNLDDDYLALSLDLVAAWQRLRPADQEAIALTTWDGLTGPQAARLLGITPTAYRLRLSRARRSLRRLLDSTTGTSGSTSPSIRKGATS